MKLPVCMQLERQPAPATSYWGSDLWMEENILCNTDGSGEKDRVACFGPFLRGAEICLRVMQLLLKCCCCFNFLATPPKQVLTHALHLNKTKGFDSIFDWLI